MEYQIVYDVLDDGPGWAAFTILSVHCFLMALLAYVHRRGWLEPVRGLPPTGRPMPRVIIVGFALGGLGFASLQYAMFLQQQQCKEWARAGQYSVVEGTISDYHHRQGSLHFRVLGTSFSYERQSAGYMGKFTSPDTPGDALRDGVRVRIAHRNGYILRIEVAAELEDHESVQLICNLSRSQRP